MSVTLPSRVVQPTQPTQPARPLTPGVSTLGVLGGGQLGRMFVHAAQVHGFRDRKSVV